MGGDFMPVWFLSVKLLQRSKCHSCKNYLYGGMIFINTNPNNRFISFIVKRLNFIC